MKPRIPVARAVACIVGLALVPGLVAQGTPPSGSTPVDVIRFGFTAALPGDTSVTDARAASLVFARAVASQVDMWTIAESVVFETADDATHALNTGQTDVAGMTSLEYLSVKDRLRATPVVVIEQAGSATDEYVLLVRGETDDIRQLARKRIAVYSPTPRSDLVGLWAEVVQREAGISPRDLATLQVSTKRTQPVMALFFNRVDAAIETRAAFETAVEMNPQLGRTIHVLARSPRLLPGVVCIRDSMEPALRSRWIQNALRLHELPGFRQSFLVLRVTRMVEWNPQLLDSAQDLVRRKQALRVRAEGAR